MHVHVQEFLPMAAAFYETAIAKMHYADEADEADVRICTCMCAMCKYTCTCCDAHGYEAADVYRHSHM